jgi:hypothetical protein
MVSSPSAEAVFHVEGDDLLRMFASAGRGDALICRRLLDQVTAAVRDTGLRRAVTAAAATIGPRQPPAPGAIDRILAFGMAAAQYVELLEHVADGATFAVVMTAGDLLGDDGALLNAVVEHRWQLTGPAADLAGEVIRGGVPLSDVDTVAGQLRRFRSVGARRRILLTVAAWRRSGQPCPEPLPDLVARVARAALTSGQEQVAFQLLIDDNGFSADDVLDAARLL